MSVLRFGINEPICIPLRNEFLPKKRKSISICGVHWYYATSRNGARCIGLKNPDGLVLCFDSKFTPPKYLQSSLKQFPKQESLLERLFYLLWPV